LLKLRRKKKLEKDQALAERNMQMQSQMNQQAAEAAMQAEVQKNQALTQNQTQLEQIKSPVGISKNDARGTDEKRTHGSRV
jgi:hypothetical protein